jgi:hypothetical protein
LLILACFGQFLNGFLTQSPTRFEGSLCDPRVVHAEHCWWFPEQPRAEPSLHGLWQSNVNVMTTDEFDACDQVTDSWPGRALLCRVSRATLP